MSPKFRQENGYIFKIYSNEEERKHIHVVRAECEAKFWLEAHAAGHFLNHSSHECNYTNYII